MDRLIDGQMHNTGAGGWIDGPKNSYMNEQIDRVLVMTRHASGQLRW